MGFGYFIAEHAGKIFKWFCIICFIMAVMIMLCQACSKNNKKEAETSTSIESTTPIDVT